MSSIPASHFVTVTPGVLAAGGNALDLSGLLLSTSAQTPIGSVLSFSTPAEVSDYYGASSAEAALADIYFDGFDNSTVKPGNMLVAQYNTAAVAAWLRGGDVSALTLTQLQAISGTLSVTIDSVVKSGTVNLSAATSFSNAATIIKDALVITGVTKASVTASSGATFTGTGTGSSLAVTAVTGVIHAGDALSGTGVPALTTIVNQVSGTAGGAGTYTTSAATTSSGASLTTASTTLDVTAVGSGTLEVGQILTGTGVTANTYITALGTGTGGTGTYTTTISQQFASTTVTAKVPGVVYDSVSGGFQVNSGTTGATSTITYGTGTSAASLKLTAATGAILSQGAAIAVPSTFMDAVVVQTTNWAAFFTGFDPDASGNANKLLLAAWTNSQDDRYAYICWDTDATAAASSPATTSLGYLINAAEYSGTALIYTPTASTNPAGSVAAFVAGSIASIDFDATNGRTTLAYRSQSGLSADVTTETAADALEANHYNYYGAVGTANDSFVFFYPGSISGDFLWIDSYVDQIWLNNALQLALMTMLTNMKSIPYNNAGLALIEAALSDTINQGLTFGAYRAGITLSAAQISQVNTSAGAEIATTLQQRGWYLQIVQASPTVRQDRGSPDMTFWYCDGQSIQHVDLSSIELV